LCARALKFEGMIIDAVVANDEIDLAKFRISYLSPVVSKFYIAESAQTFQGRSKPLNFAPVVEELRRQGAEVEIVEVPPSPQDAEFGDAWDRGIYQRYWFLEFIAKRHPDAAIIFTDIDEVPSLEQVVWADQHLAPQEIRSLPMAFTFRFANWLFGPRFLHYQPGVILRGTAYRPRCRDSGVPPVIGAPGAHLSYIGFTAEQVAEKFSSFEHIDLDVEHLSRGSVLDFADHWGIDHIGRPSQPGFGLLREVPQTFANPVVDAAAQFLPHWSKPFPRQPKIRRLVASSALGYFRATTDERFLLDPSRQVFDGRFLRHLLTVGVHTLIRATHTGTLIKKLQGRLSS